MAATSSEYLFTEISNFFLNQLLGYQDVNEQKDGLNRLEAAFASQHMWDRDSPNATWNAAHTPDPTQGPTRDLGNHGGAIGIDDGADQTTYYGDGQYLHNLQHIAIGSYQGNGANNRTITTGFSSLLTCSAVIIQGWLYTAAIPSWNYGLLVVVGASESVCFTTTTGVASMVGTAQATTGIVINANQNFIVGDGNGGPNYVHATATYYYIALGV